MISCHLQNLVHRHKMRLLIDDHAGIGRDGDLTITEGIERINGYVRGNARRQINLNLNLSRCIVYYLFDLDFAFVIGFENGLDQTGGGYSIGNILDQEGRFVFGFDVGTDTQLSSSFATIIVTRIDHASSREVRNQLRLATFEDCNRSLAQLNEVVRHNLGR